MNQSHKEKKRRLFELSNVKIEHLNNMAQQVGYSGSKSSKEKIIEYLCSIDKDEFDSLCWQYVNAENSTNFIFIMKEETSKKIKSEILMILNKLPKTPTPDENHIFLDNHYFNIKNDEYNIRLNEIKMNKMLRTWNFDKNEMEFQEAHTLNKIFIKILYGHNLIIVRTSGLGLAKNILMLLFTKYFNQFIPISFSKEDVLEIVKFMMILRGANLRYESDTEIQSATFSAGSSERDGILKNLKKSETFRKAWEEGDLRNCRFSNAKSSDKDSDDLRSKDVVTLGMNFIESKIYFITKVSEEETVKWILDILSNIDLKGKIKKNYKKDFL